MNLGLDLNCPLVGLDLETTGPSRKTDRIVQIAVVKMYPNSSTTEWQTLVNPGIPIAPEVTAIHGVTDAMVADAPTFEMLVTKLASGLKGCDFCGYNVRFDLDVLASEFRRVGGRPEQYLNGRILDGYRIFNRHEPRNLTAAAQFYLGEKHEGAHDAMADVRMTLRVIQAQRERYGLSDSMEELYRTYFEEPADGAIDPDSKLIYKHGEPVVNFGQKNIGKPLSQCDDGYLDWLMRGDFTPSVKAAVRTEQEKRKKR